MEYFLDTADLEAIGKINDFFPIAGVKSVTVGVDIFEKLIYHPYTDWSMETFNSDWEKVYGKKTLLDLL